MYQTRLSTSSKDVEVQSNSVEQVQDDVTILVTRLEQDLRRDVFSVETVGLLEKIRFITDLQSIAKEIKAKGSILVGSLRGNKYLSYIRSITASLRDIDDLENKDNYKKFLKKLEHYINGKKYWKINKFENNLRLFIDRLLRGHRIINARINMCSSQGVSGECS